MKLFERQLAPALWRVAYLAALFAQSCSLVEARFLLISSPSESTIYAAKLPSNQDLIRGSRQLTAERIVGQGNGTSSGLSEPSGIAVDSYRGMLYIADPGSSSIIAMDIFTRSSGSRVAADNARTLVSGVDCHWVAVDPYGNLFYSDKSGNAVWSMSPEAIDDALNPFFSQEANVTEGATIHNPIELYSAVGDVAVNTPHGVAADSADVFWANGASGTQSGVVMQGKTAYKGENRTNLVLELAKNTDAAFGVCLSHTHIFFTASTGELFALRTVGGTTITINTDMQEPRGCAHDGDGTLFVADRQGGKVYSLAAGGLSQGTSRQLQAALDVPDAFAVAVFAGSTWRPTTAVLIWICVLLTVRVS